MEKKKTTGNEASGTDKLSENWPEESVQEILDYIEEQGVYIRE